MKKMKSKLRYVKNYQTLRFDEKNLAKKNLVKQKLTGEKISFIFHFRPPKT